MVSIFEEMKTLKFKPNLAKQILSGEKTLTWKLFDDKDLQIGDRLNFIDQETGENFAKAEIANVIEKTLEEVTENDYEGHEKYKSDEEMLKTYKKYYGDKVTLDTPLKIIKFKLIEN